MIAFPRLSLLATTALSASLCAWPVLAAGPEGETVAAGNAAISRPDGQTTTINQFSQRAVVDWRQFHVSEDHTVNFIQPSADAVILNRINGGEPSRIMGTLNANGTVMLVNPDGILFGPHSRIDVGGLVATTHDIANDDFMAGRYRFTQPGNPSASIVNEGLITARDGGVAALVAPGVRNSGIISARLGQVGLASANEFTLDLYGDSLIKLKIDDTIIDQVIDVATGQPMNALVDNQGTLSAHGGQVALTAVTARRVVDHVINNDGIIEADTVGMKGGKIVLGAQTAATKTPQAPVQKVRVSGEIRARGQQSGQTGGDVHIVGEMIGLSRATIDVSGAAGGGLALIGGDVQGGKASAATLARYGLTLQEQGIPTASNVIVDRASVIDASAIDDGDGGQVIAWADDTMNFQGTVNAKGGRVGGDGGFAETSGEKILHMSGVADTSAVQGNAGTWLLDPLYTRLYTSPSSDSYESASTVAWAPIQASINSGGNVILENVVGGVPDLFLSGGNYGRLEFSHLDNVNFQVFDDGSTVTNPFDLDVTILDHQIPVWTGNPDPPPNLVDFVISSYQPTTGGTFRIPGTDFYGELLVDSPWGVWASGITFEQALLSAPSIDISDSTGGTLSLNNPINSVSLNRVAVSGPLAFSTSSLELGPLAADSIDITADTITPLGLSSPSIVSRTGDLTLSTATPTAATGSFSAAGQLQLDGFNGVQGSLVANDIKLTNYSGGASSVSSNIDAAGALSINGDNEKSNGKIDFGSITRFRVGSAFSVSEDIPAPVGVPNNMTIGGNLRFDGDISDRSITVDNAGMAGLNHALTFTGSLSNVSIAEAASTTAGIFLSGANLNPTLDGVVTPSISASVVYLHNSKISGFYRVEAASIDTRNVILSPNSLLNYNGKFSISSTALANASIAKFEKIDKTRTVSLGVDSVFSEMAANIASDESLSVAFNGAKVFDQAIDNAGSTSFVGPFTTSRMGVTGTGQFGLDGNVTVQDRIGSPTSPVYVSFPEPHIALNDAFNVNWKGDIIWNASNPEHSNFTISASATVLEGNWQLPGTSTINGMSSLKYNVASTFVANSGSIGGVPFLSVYSPAVTASNASVDAIEQADGTKKGTFLFWSKNGALNEIYVNLDNAAADTLLGGLGLSLAGVTQLSRADVEGRGIDIRLVAPNTVGAPNAPKISDRLTGPDAKPFKGSYQFSSNEPVYSENALPSEIQAIEVTFDIFNLIDDILGLFLPVDVPIPLLDEASQVIIKRHAEQAVKNNKKLADLSKLPFSQWGAYLND